MCSNYLARFRRVIADPEVLIDKLLAYSNSFVYARRIAMVHMHEVDLTSVGEIYQNDEVISLYQKEKVIS